jgi:penicillin amidase
MQGLAGRVDVTRDARGVPHIEAEFESDAWSALGFAHAQDRLAQVLWLRRLARGRTAEVVGERGLPADRLARTLGIGMHADAEALRLDPETRRVLDAYSAGINSRMERIRAGLVAPPLHIAAESDLVEPWTPADSIAIVKLMAWSAGPAVETAAVLWDLIDRLGAVAARPFMPTGLGVRGADMRATLPPSQRSGAVSGIESGVDGVHGADSGEAVGSTESGFRPLLSGSAGGTTLGDTYLNSTAWVVSGRRTQSGAPILAVAFHLPPTVPSLVYQAQLRSGDFEVAGATVPGVPVFWAGRNRLLAWAATPARVVTADLHRETPNPDDPDEYRHGRTWRKMRERDETIEVARPGRPPRRETLRVRETRHGPIVNQVIGRGGAPLALAWTGALPGNGVVAMLGVARAQDEDALRLALRDHHEPAISLLYADASGAGLQVAGWIPRRRLPSGLVPVPGRQTVFDWRGPLKLEQLPHRRLESDSDWLVASDGPLVDGLGGRVEWLWRTGEAAARLESSLNALSQSGPPLGLSDLMALRPERWPLRTPEAVAALLRLAGDRETLSPEAGEVADILVGWDGTIVANSRGAAAVHLVFHHLARELFAGPAGPERLQNYLALSHARPQAVAERVVLAADSAKNSAGWPEPERVGHAVRSSLRATWMSLALRFGDDRERWRWDGLVGPSLRPFAREGAYEEIAGKAHRELPSASGAGPVAAINPTDPFEVESITSYRLVMDLAAPDRMSSFLAPGQSEHPLHPHYDDGLEASLPGPGRQLGLGRLPADRVRLPGTTFLGKETHSTVASEQPDAVEGRVPHLVLEHVEIEP